MDDVNAYIELIKDNIEYEHHMKYDDWQNRLCMRSSLRLSVRLYA